MNFGQYYEANSHSNSVTGCVIWDADVVKGEPLANGMKVRKAIYEAVNGPQPYRSKFVPSCENPRCVKIDHITVETPSPAQHDYPSEVVEQAWEMYNSQGMRQAAIAEKLQLDPSTVSKYLRHARALKGVPSED